jgi:hypothetical protein
MKIKSKCSKGWESGKNLRRFKEKTNLRPLTFSISTLINSNLEKNLEVEGLEMFILPKKNKLNHFMPLKL